MGFEMSAEVLIAIATALGSVFAVLHTRYEMHANKQESEQKLKEKSAEIEPDREAWELERDKLLQQKLDSYTEDMKSQITRAQSDVKKFEDRYTQALQDIDYHKEMRTKAETELEGRNHTIEQLIKQHEQAMGKAIEVAVREAEKATRLQIENDTLRKELDKVNAKIATMESKITSLENSRKDDERRHQKEIDALVKQVAEKTE